MPTKSWYWNCTCNRHGNFVFHLLVLLFSVVIDPYLVVRPSIAPRDTTECIWNGGINIDETRCQLMGLGKHNMAADAGQLQNVWHGLWSFCTSVFSLPALADSYTVLILKFVSRRLCRYYMEKTHFTNRFLSPLTEKIHLICSFTKKNQTQFCIQHPV